MDQTKLPRNLQITLGEIAKKTGGTLDGPAELQMNRLTSIETGDREGLAFAENAKYVLAAKGKVGALLIPNDLDSLGIPCVRVENPRLAFFHLLHEAQRPWNLGYGISEKASVDESAFVHESASVGAYAVVDKNARLEAGAKVYPFAYIGENCAIGEGSVIGPHVVLMQDVIIGKHCTIQPGAILGADGFGYVWDGKSHVKIPQVGRIEIGDNVEIGAGATIDRATSGATKIGDGSKIDNLVQVAHNCQIGRDVVLASQVGIAGTSEIGDRCVFGGQVGIGDHVVIAADVQIAGQGGTGHNIDSAGQYYGMPAKPLGSAMRAAAIYQKLPELAKRLREAEQRIADLELLMISLTEESGGELIG